MNEEVLLEVPCMKMTGTTNCQIQIISRQISLFLGYCELLSPIYFGSRNATIKSREVVLKVASPFNRKRSVLCVSCSYTILFAFRKDSDEEKNKFQRLLKEAVKWYDGNGGGEQSISQAAAEKSHTH